MDGKPDNLEIYADLPGLDLNGSTIPPDIILTGGRPDLVLINREEMKIYLLELTCSFETNIQAANAAKKLRYTQLKLDLESQGWTCILLPFEVGSRGHVTRSNKVNLITIFKMANIKSSAIKCIKSMSKLSLSCSYSIFHAYKQPTWRDPPLLTS